MPNQAAAKSPQETLREEIASLQSQVESDQNKVRLTSLRDELEDLESRAYALPQRIRSLRSAGYVFEKQLESQAGSFDSRWKTIRPQAGQYITQQSSLLVSEIRSAEAMILQLSGRVQHPAAAYQAVNQMKSSLSTIESKVAAAESAVRGMYDTFQQELDTLCTHLERVEWTLGQGAEASFRLSPSECLIMAVKAVWVKDGKEDKTDPKGVLFLSDQRILFEQKQEIATRKVLFITTEKEMVQQLLVDTLAAHIETMKGTRAGLFNNEDHLELTFRSGAPFQRLQFHLDGQDSRAWQALIGQVTSGHFDEDRAIAPDQAAVERARKAPSQCPACGATVSQPVLRGMETLTCEYCGYVMRLQ